MALTELLVNQGDPGTEPWPVSISESSTATRSTVAASTTTVELLAANANRTAFTVYNDSGKKLFLIFGAGGDVSDFSVLMTSKAYFDFSGYTGEVRGVWDGSGGNARVTEFTL